MRYLLFLLLSIPASAQVGNPNSGRWVVTDRCVNHDCMTWWQWYCDTLAPQPTVLYTDSINEIQLLRGGTWMSIPSWNSDSVTSISTSNRSRKINYTESYVKHTGMDKKEHRWRTYTDSAHRALIDTSWHEYPICNTGKETIWFSETDVQNERYFKVVQTSGCSVDSMQFIVQERDHVMHTRCAGIDACMTLYYKYKYPQSYTK